MHAYEHGRKWGVHYKQASFQAGAGPGMQAGACAAMRVVTRPGIGLTGIAGEGLFTAMRKQYCALNKQMHCKALIASAPPLMTWTGPGEQAQVDFQLAEQLYARAVIRQPTSVALWLGADVMLEFQLEEAAELLVAAREGWSIVLLYSQLMGLQRSAVWSVMYMRAFL